MTQITLSPRTLRAMRLVRIAAWTGVALCAGIQLFRPETGLAEALEPSVFKASANVQACGCAKHMGNIS